MHHRLPLCLLLVVALLIAAPLGADPLDDGPYVFHTGTQTEAQWVCSGKVEKRAIADDGRVEPVCGSVPALVLDRAPAIAPDQLPQPRRWAAVSDIHGQAGLFLRLLAAHGLVDRDAHWVWGKGVLVITGDVLDRGPQQLEALWAIYRLAQEAALAGGRVEMLLGNHEIMVIVGDLRYLNPKYQHVANLLGRSYDQLFAADSELGAWLRRRATLLKLGDTLFVHGGLHPRLANGNFDLAALNAAFRARLGATREALHPDPEGEWLLGAEGPTWYRGYFEPERATTTQVDALLAIAKIKRVVVGHTTQAQITSLYGGRVIGIDAALKNGERGELLIWDRDKLWRGLLDGTRSPLASSDDAP